MTIKIYGIKNCNTMKKTFDWLEGQSIAYDFHDYKKLGADEDLLRAAFAQYGWESVINRKGMTWRKLPDDVKAGMDEAGAMKAAIDNPSMIKRPILVSGDVIELGYDDARYNEILA